MIQTQSILHVADNSGVKTVKCLGVYAKKSKYASVGDYVIVSVKSLKTTLISKSSSSLKTLPVKGQIYKALIIRTRKKIKPRKYGFSLKFDSNNVILLNTQENLVGTRIFGPVTRELRSAQKSLHADHKSGHKKILSQAKRLI